MGWRETCPKEGTLGVKFLLYVNNHLDSLRPYAKKRRRVLLTSLSQSSIGQKRIDGLKN